jgi:small subunit ribosomal protein S17
MAENETPETEGSADTGSGAEDVPEAPREGEAGAMEASASVTPPASEEAAQRASAAPAPEPAEVLSPKERKRRAKEAKAGRRRPGTPEERAAERTRKRELRRQTRARLREKRRRQPAVGTGELGGAVAARPQGEGRQKTRQGVVVSDLATKTITVRIDTAHRHRRYEKIVRTSRTLHAHDERGEAHVGDTVIVRECRPLSRTKRWRLERVVERAG